MNILIWTLLFTLPLWGAVVTPSIPPDTAPDLSVTIPYTDHIKEEFEKKVAEMIKEMKLKGCIMGSISANADDGIKMVTITATCLEWEKKP